MVNRTRSYSYLKLTVSLKYSKAIIFILTLIISKYTQYEVYWQAGSCFTFTCKFSIESSYGSKQSWFLYKPTQMCVIGKSYM